MKKLSEQSNLSYFSKFEDIHFNQRDEEVIGLSIFQMKNAKTSEPTQDQIQKVDKMKISQQNKITILRGMKEHLEQKILEEKQTKQRMNVIRKMQMKQERLELQNSLKKQDPNKEIDSPSESSTAQSSPKKDNKKQYEELTSLVKSLTLIEKDLVKMKSERNRVSEQLEDIKEDVQDIKVIFHARSSDMMRQDTQMSYLRNQITVMSQQGLCTPREYVSNLNQTRLNQTRLNATIMEEVKFKFENVKDYLKDAYSKLKNKRNNTNGGAAANGQNTGPQNTNRILSGLDLQ